MKRFFKIDSIKNKVSNSNEKLNGTQILSEKSSSFINEKVEKSKDICLIQDSPYYIHKVAQTERLDEFKSLYYGDPTRLYLRDTKGLLPVHYAASRGKLKILEFILEKTEPSMINEVDTNGNTPFHLAIEKGHIESCRFLIDHNADLTIKNKDFHTPLHYCIICNKPDVLEFILDHAPDIDVNISGDAGGTPLHFCAYDDNLECAEKLVAHGARFCKPCNNGFFPIHLAATRCSNKVFEFLLNEGAKHGYTKEKLLSFVDPDNHKPLHSAVQVCNIEAVKLCLQNGAKIDDVIEVDHSTAIHVACAQGSLDILKIMFQKQPELKSTVVHMQDINLMTPLHKASMFDHVEVVEYLLKNGADIDAIDKEKRTPLLLAATRNCARVVAYLLMENANFKAKDSKLQNILHLVVIHTNPVKSMSLTARDRPSSSTSIRDVDCKSQNSVPSMHLLHDVTRELFKTNDNIDLLNEKDIDGCTPMHYASKLGLVGCLKSLIQFGGNVATLNHQKQSALHFAAKYGRYNTCMQVLSSANYKNYINERDTFGYTPLHLATQNGHSKVVKLLMQKGALLYRAYDGNNPFHEAAKNAYTNCMSIIFNIDNNILDSVNKNGDTALHLAAKEGHSNVVEYLLDIGASFLKNKDDLTFFDYAIINNNSSVLLTITAHSRWQEALNLTSKPYKTPFLGIIEYSSEVTQAVLERCITRKDVEGTNGKIYKITYNFKYINWNDRFTDKNGKEQHTPMLPLVYMVKYGRTDCLSHTLCETMLKRKWDRYGLPMYTTTIAFYLVYLLMLTLIVTTHPSCIHDDVYDYYSTNNETHCYELINSQDSLFNSFQKMHIYKVLAIFCIIFSILNLFKEMMQLVLDKMDYFKNFQVYIQMILYISTIVFAIPFTYQGSFSLHFQWEVGSVAIFAAWFNLLLYMQRFYVFGIYVVMFTEILKTLFKVIFLFSILIIAFGLVFYILLRDEENRANSTPWISIFRQITMMIGELDGVESIISPYTDDSPYTLHFGNMTIFFEVLFIILVPILLTNLLIGLAVGDIESIQKNAKLKREAMQVQLHVDLEMRMPRKILDKVNEMEYTVTYGESVCSNGFDIFKFLSNIFTKLNQNEVEVIDNPSDNNNLLYLEMIKQKQRINTMKSQMDQQTELLKMIVQKMEIKTEDDDNDSNTAHAFSNEKNKRTELWNTSITNTRLRNLVLKQLITRNDSFEEQN